MISLAFGMSLRGIRPVVCFERHDFLLLALDALVNHVDKMPALSGDQYKVPIVIRAIVGAKYPLNPGPQHTQNYTNALVSMLKNTPVYVPESITEFTRAWEAAGQTPSGAVVIIEHRDWYDLTIEELLNKGERANE